MISSTSNITKGLGELILWAGASLTSALLGNLIVLSRTKKTSKSVYKKHIEPKNQVFRYKGCVCLCVLISFVTGS